MLNRRSALSLGISAATSPAWLLNHSHSADHAALAVDIVDTNVSLFRWPFRRLPLDEGLELRAKLVAIGIGQAWAGSYEGLLQRDISKVNERLNAACGDRKLLIPIGSINPTLPDWEEDLRQCIHEYRMPGIRLHPGYHGYKLDDPRFVTLLQRAAGKKCFIQLTVAMEDERTQSDALRVVEVDLAPLPSLLTRIDNVCVQLLNYKPNRMLNLLGKIPNLFLDSARVEGTDGVPHLVENLPPGRVLFGSHAPFLIPEAALIRTHESGKLDDHTLGRVLAGNAKRLLKQESNHDANTYRVQQRELTSAAQSKWSSERHVANLGLPSTKELKQYRIWDSYFTPSFAHPGPNGYGQLIADVERSLPAIEKGQFEKLCYFAHVGLGTTNDPTFESLVKAQPDLVLKPIERWPSLLIGMIQLNANDVSASLDALDRWVRDGPMLGVYFPGSGPGAICCSHRNVHPLVERIHELGGVIMVHTWFKTGGKQGPGDSTPTELAELAAKYPEQKFLCAHAGGEWEKGIRAVRGSPNILIETSGFDATAGFIEMAIRELGAERIVFGSHLPSRSLGTELAKIIGANIPEEAKRMLLGENFRRLLKHHGKP
jgi:predicted TIM-barrel fold metal-dependent hydrolase